MNIIDLNGSWTLTNENRKISCPATVPGCVHTDLLSADIIKDPFYRDNEYTQMWVCYEDWTYTRNFEVPADLLKYKKIMLECMGLDTLATIYINGKEIAKTKNMHRRYAFDIKDYISAGTNEISIFFASAPKYAEPLSNTGTGFGPGPYSLPGSERVRKAMYTWGWDWGPKIPSAGIWRDIFIKAYNDMKIDDFHIYQSDVTDNKVTFDMETDADVFGKNTDYEIEIKSPSGEVLETCKEKLTVADSVSFTIENPEIWYPAGYGEHPLYTVTLKTNDEIIEKKIGVRKIEWVEDKDEWGRTFYVRVNGIPIFVKGANYIPMDQFPSKENIPDINRLLDIVLDTNMNTVRIWGGGIYESDDFYNLCDEKGILVWQDFAYACSFYPMDDSLLVEEYEEEAIDNIKRLRHHPSLMIWSGNNEIEKHVWVGNPPYGCIDDKYYREDFKELFEIKLRNIVSDYDPDTFYIRSSPHSDEIFVDPDSHDMGNTHYWGVWHGRAPFTDYRKYHTRFLSEFGFQAMPSMETMKTFSLPKDWNMYSKIMEYRQKSPVGNEIIMNYLSKNYKLPNSFRSLVYISQILQADGIRYGIEHYRRNRNNFRCMGTIYWQLNDCWPAISWASIEYSFRWKALNYMAREFFKPVDLTIEEDENSVRLHIVNDTLNDFSGTVRYQLCKVDGTVIFADTMEGTCKSLSANMIKEIDLTDYIKENGRDEVFFSCGLDDMAEKHVFFTPVKYVDLIVPNITVKACGNKLKVTTDVPSFYTQIDVPDTDVRLERNFILLLPGKEYIIDIAENDGLSVEEIAEKAQVITVANSY